MKRLLLSILAILALTIAAEARSPREAKPVVSILGDSYSTFKGYIPEGNACWYETANNPKRTDVNDVKQTWWWQFIAKGGYILGVNDSYSGATISYTGYRGEDYADRSFITRLPRLGSPDILLIFGATNDCWAEVPLGEYTYGNLTRGHYYEFRPALGKLLEEAINRFPGTDIYFIANCDLTAPINESIREVCAHYSIPCIWLEGIDKMSNHPSRLGMTQIADQLLKAIK